MYILLLTLKNRTQTMLPLLTFQSVCAVAKIPANLVCSLTEVSLILSVRFCLPFAAYVRVIYQIHFQYIISGRGDVVVVIY